MFHRLYLILLLVISTVTLQAQDASSDIRVLFLGDRGHHQPAARAQQLIPALNPRGIRVTYTEEVEWLRKERLAEFDCLLLYANIDTITPTQEEALLEFVAGGKGFVPLHCASFCFRNSTAFVELVGAQFKSHGTGVFSTRCTEPKHPIMAGLPRFESWDETYVHQHHTNDRTVLSVREEGAHEEPWTWVRTHGKGRVFYTAWGHDQRTWSQPGFVTLVERGIRWASGKGAVDGSDWVPLKPLEYRPAKVAFYPPRGPRTGDGEWNQMQLPLGVEESMRHMVTPPEVRPVLFASEPDLLPVIAMNWDERGRLWVAESVDYPNQLQPEGQGNDRISILEDTDGDGRADRFTVFADRLSIPTGLTFARGGVIVQQAPSTLFLKDTDGDDRADHREVLLSGWGTTDTHSGPSNIRWGLDNWIWGMVGYSGFRGTVQDTELRFGSGFYRFRPDGSALEFVRGTNNNTWGLGFSEEGLTFGSTANNNPSVYMPLANRYYESVRGWSARVLGTIATTAAFYPVTDKVRQVDAHGRFTAGAGHALYTARRYPKKYWNRTAFVAGPTGHLVGTFELQPVGADFQSHCAWNLLASDDEWCAPTVAEVGPDGNVWVVDWYNYIVQHNPTPRGFEKGRGNAYITELRDKSHCRIYRLVHGPDTPSVKVPLGSVAERVAALKNDNMFWRLHAQRLLVEQQQRDAIPALLSLVSDASTDAIGLNTAVIHGLWTLHGLGALNGTHPLAVKAAVAALRHSSMGVRRSALQVLPRNADMADRILEHRLLWDPEAQVRLAAALALSEMPPSETVGAEIYTALESPEQAQDRWIRDALTVAGARHDVGFLQTVLAASQGAARDSSSRPAEVEIPINGSLEKVEGSLPKGWAVRHYGGQAEHHLDERAHSGEVAIRISSTRGANTSVRCVVPVKPEHTYRLSGWIKTEGVKPRGGADGALFNVHELQGANTVKTTALKGNTDWRKVSVTFNSRGREVISINCLFGGWGSATGVAWFDDISLVEVPGNTLDAGSSREMGAVVRVVMTHYASRGPAESVVTLLARMRGADPMLAEAMLAGLVAGWPETARPSLTVADRVELGVLMEALPAGQQAQLLTLADRWGERSLFSGDVEAVTRAMREQVADHGAEVELRVNAAGRLIRLDDSLVTADWIAAQIQPQEPAALVTGLLHALAFSRVEATGRAIIGTWDRLTPMARRTAIGVLVNRLEWTLTLLEAVKDGRIPASDLAIEYRQQLIHHGDTRVAQAAQALGQGIANQSREEVLARLLPYLQEEGTQKRGQELFRELCVQCHTFQGEGQNIGPDLTGVGVRDPREILSEVVNPNRSLEANYRQWMVQTTDGVVLTGKLQGETRTTIELQTLDGTVHVVQRMDIERLTASNLSIMPEGLVDEMPPTDLASLMMYLRQE